MRQHLARIACVVWIGGTALAAEPQVDSSQLPRVPPTPPEKALTTFKVKPGFRIELVAAEPLVVSPVAMSFDEDGRLYVVEMRDYSERRPERLGRIRLLEDTDGDGRFDKSTVFAEDLPWPTAVICWAGGVFVGATPDILWFKDTNGDGKADVRETIFTGFAADYAPFATNKLNVQALMNSFNWSLDNRIHGATSFSGGKVKLVDSEFTRAWRRQAFVASPSPGGEGRGEGELRKTQNSKLETPNTFIDLRGRDFSFDPRTLEMRPESGGGQHGMSFDNRGRKFVCSNSDHIQLIMYEDRYAARNPYFNMPSPRVSIAVDGPAAEVFRISPDEPWRVLRTQWRVAGLVPGPVEGGGRPSGYFTGATGVTIYRGDAYGEDFVGDAFIGDAGSNLVHRKKLRPDGVLLRAERPADEQKVEFLASTDNWFRPVQFANAPDGCLYIADMYREVIEHPWSLPANLKKHLDLNSGNDRGRIYRIVPENFKQPPPPRLSKASTTDLVKLLVHPSGWHRDTAARLLYERQDRDSIAKARALLEDSDSSLTRLHALYVLQGLGSLRGGDLSLACSDKDGAVRQHAVRLAEPYGFNWMAADRDPLVRLQVAFSIAQRTVQDPFEAHWMWLLVRENQDSAWVRAAVLNGVGELAMPLLEEMSRPGQEASQIGDADLAATREELARFIGAKNKSNEVLYVLNQVQNVEGLKRNARLVIAMFEGMRRVGVSLESAVTPLRLDRILSTAREIAADAAGAQESRLGAIRLLGFESYAKTREFLSSQLKPDQPQTIQLAVVATMDGYSDAGVGRDLLISWPRLAGRVREEILKILLKRKERLAALLDAIDIGSVRREELSLAQQSQLRSHRDPAIRKQAANVLGRAPTTARQPVVEGFQLALSLKGDGGNGRRIFQERCASCHKLGNEGNALGPDLATVKSAGKEKLLIAILDPNREVAPNFASYSVETKDGESLLGVLSSENAVSVTLRMAGGAESVIARANIASLQSQGRSLMPEGLEEGLKPQDIADLLEFILGGP